jgi:hypothetical protein
MHGFVAQEASGAFSGPDGVNRSDELVIGLLDPAFVYWKHHS